MSSHQVILCDVPLGLAMVCIEPSASVTVHIQGGGRATFINCAALAACIQAVRALPQETRRTR